MTVRKKYVAAALILACAVLATMGRAAAGEAPVTEAGAEEYGVDLAPRRIVVTATRIPTPVENIPGAVSVFSAAPVEAAPAPSRFDAASLDRAIATPSAPAEREPESASRRGTFQSGLGLMEQRQYRTVTDALRVTPGMSVDQTGGAGGKATMRIRGMDSNHTMFLMDGMPMADVATPERGTDFAGYNLDNIGQLEVLRGPQSVLYGSGAMGGVVGFSSAKGEGPFRGSVTTEGGSRGTVMTRLKAQAGNDRGDFSFGGSLFRTDGISSRDKRMGNREKDSDGRGSMNMRLGWNAGELLRLDLFANALSYLTELDSYLGDDPHGYVKTRGKRYMIRPQATLTLLEGRWVQKAGFGFLRHDRQNKDDVANAIFSGRNRFVGDTTKFDYQSIFYTHENNAILAGLDVVTESSKKWEVGYGPGKTGATKYDSVTTTSLYVEDQYNYREALFLNAGLRYDHHDDFGDKVTWKGGASYLFPTGTRLKSSAGTGFRAPSASELYMDYPDPFYPFYANKNLKPETSFGWDAGIEQSFFDNRLLVGSTFFWNKVKNKIDTVSHPSGGSTLANMNEYRTRGVESFVQYSPIDKVVVTAQHTWLGGRQDPMLFATGSTLLRRPRHEASMNVDYHFHEKGTVTAGVRFKGKRKDLDNASRPTLSSHTVMRIAASWKANETVEIFGRVENLFNKQYQDVYGYGTEGRSFYAGATISF